MNPAAALVPPAAGETTSMIIWPTIGALRPGRLVGQLAGVKIGWGRFFTLGKLLAVATIPLSLGVFAWQLLPFVYRRYRITSRRIVIDRGLGLVEETSLGLDQFDRLDIDVRPGQEWLRAGDLVFLRDGVEVFRLPGVSRPEPLRQVCLKARAALLGVRGVLQQQNEVDRHQ
jgi:hypothetical protein